MFVLKKFAIQIPTVINQILKNKYKARAFTERLSSDSANSNSYAMSSESKV